MIGLYDSSDTLITKLVQTALSKPDVVEVKNRTLDGKWHIQTIGEGGTILDVKANLTLAEKNILDSLKKTSSPVKVIFDDLWYIGPIDGEIDYTRKPFSEYPIFTTSFTMLVNDEGAV